MMLLQHARSTARVDVAGEIVLLEDQDRRLWDDKLIAEGVALLDKAMRHQKPGPYQIQAAIAALHARAAPPAPRLAGYFHFFGVRGALLLQLGRTSEARTAFDQAIALAATPAEATHIRLRLD